jgi:hypothetical protein
MSTNMMTSTVDAGLPWSMDESHDMGVASIVLVARDGELRPHRTGWKEQNDDNLELAG